MWGGVGFGSVFVSTTLPRLMADILQQLKAIMVCLYVFQHTDSVGCDMRPWDPLLTSMVVMVIISKGM